MSEPRQDKLVEEIRFNEKYAHLFYSEYIPEKYEADSLPTIKRKTLLTDDYVKRLTGDGSEGGMIPANVRYMEELEKGHLVVIEEPPAYRTIKSTMSFSNEVSRLKRSGKLDMMGYTNWVQENKSPHSFTLAFPYVIFILYVTKYNEVTSGQVFLRTQQMSGLSDYLLKAPMCNISDGGFVCFGKSINKRAQSFTGAIQHAIMVWWSAVFNTDYTYNYNAYKDVPVLNSYLEWQYMGQANPMFIYSADWIKMNCTLGKRLEYTKTNHNLMDKKSMGYKELAQMFYEAQDTGIEMKVSKRSKRTYKLFYDIAQGTYLDAETNITVGDSFETKNGKMAYIDSFVGFADGSDIMYVQIDIDGRLSLLKLTENARKFLAEKITEQRRADEAPIPNGTVVKPDQILIVKHGENEAYHKVEYIRKSRGFDGEDILEVKMGNNYYLTSNLDATEFKVDQPEIDGIKLDKNSQYIIMGDNNHPGAKAHAYRMRFNSIDVTSRGNISAQFVNCYPPVRNHTMRLELSNGASRRRIYKLDEVRRMEGRLRIGRQLFIIPNNSMMEPREETVWGVEGIAAYDGNHSMKRIKGEATKALLDTDRFFVEGADFDTEFVIGDKVVVANWRNPLDVLTVKMIQGFKYDESSGNISFIVIDKESNLSEVEYVDGYRGIIHTGKVRKVTNKVGRLSAGTKIRATVAGITCFPKKDVNIIVAFIIDTNREPLVLCSNGCTLWLNDVMENFKRITLKSKQWPTLDHAPLDLSKIKFQAGDIINGLKDYKSKHGYLLYGPSTTRALRAMPMEYFGSYPESYSLDRYMTRECRLDCIPAPRVSPAKIEQVGVLRGMIDLHSYDVFENNLSTRYLNQRRA